MKVFHIHTNYNFVGGTKNFEGDYFDNAIIIFKTEEIYNGTYQDSAKFFEKEQIDEVVELCKEADLVVLYDLDVIKSSIALALPKNIKIAWRFFGYELYKRIKNEVLSKNSQLFLSQKKPISFLKFPKKLIRSVYKKFKIGISHDDLFHKAIDRIDYMFVVCKQEHVYLSQYWNNLPQCIELSIRSLDRIFEPDITNKENKIVVGNSRNIYNNHLDVINMIEKAQNKEHYQFELLFNYGNEGDYTNAVRKVVQEKSYFRLIEDFMPKEEFETFYYNISALVINSYRQMAMSNIFFALKNGVKVYLNKKNIMMKWFLENSIKVYPTDSLATDIEKKNLELDKKTAKENFRSLENLYQNYSHEKFQKRLYSKLKKSI